MSRAKEIALKAREFLGTPFMHQGRTKHRGIDCVGLPLCIADELRLRDPSGVLLSESKDFRFPDYPEQPIGDFVLRKCRSYLVEEFRPPKEGDILCIRLPKDPCHVAVVTDLGYSLGIIHVYHGKGRSVVEHGLTEPWCKRIAGVFTYSEKQ